MVARWTHWQHPPVLFLCVLYEHARTWLTCVIFHYTVIMVMIMVDKLKADARRRTLYMYY